MIFFQVLNMKDLTGLLALKDCELETKSHLATLNPCPGNNQELFPTVYFAVFLSCD